MDAGKTTTTERILYYSGTKHKVGDIDDSGKQSRVRHIRGGRNKVRTGLYQAAISAIRHCPTIRAFYTQLKARGKASKVALVAVARKILVLANALLRSMKPYEARSNSV